jgi:hypothetical protein
MKKKIKFKKGKLLIKKKKRKQTEIKLNDYEDKKKN